MKKYLILGICLLLGISNARAQVAQVTIGSNEVPRAGAILDLKSEADGTSYKGLALPRVKLTDKDNLYPMFEGATPGTPNDKYDTPAKKAEEDKKHLGLMVYSVGGCDLDGNGVYTWTENGWEKVDKSRIVRSGLHVNVNEIEFWNGSLNPPVDITVGWSPYGATYASPTYTTSGLTFYMSHLSGRFTKSPSIVSVKPKDFTDSDLKNNPFLVKTGTIVFKLDNSICNNGNQQQHSVSTRLVNKALTVDGSRRPEPLVVTYNSTKTFNIASNAKWTVKVLPETNAAISCSDEGLVWGEEKNINGSSDARSLSCQINTEVTKSKVNYLVFSDNHSPKRFRDVKVSIFKCSYTKDLTMSQYRDLWEEKYGLDPSRYEEDSDGDVSKNKNKVRWHTDRDGNIFFSALFGGVRWMTTNFAGHTYDTQSTPPSLIEQSANTGYYDTGGKWAYGASTDPGGSINAKYTARPRIGMKYNWRMATGREIKSYSNDQANQTKYQGVCPNGWHVPSFNEWEIFLGTVMASSHLHSTNIKGESTVITLKDVCEDPSTGIVSRKQQGESFDILDGGAGILYPEALGGAYFMTSTYRGHSSGHRTYNVLLNQHRNDASISEHGYATELSYLRCVKN